MEQQVNDESTLALYQTFRATISNFDTILTTLLTQGNTFVVAILSIPLVTQIKGIPAAAVSLFALVLGLFLLLGNILYLSLLRRAVIVSEQIERDDMKNIDDKFKITLQLSKIPFSATRGSNFLYLVLPILWIISAFVEGGIYLYNISTHWLIGYILLGLLIVMTAIAVYGVYLKAK